MKRRLLCTLVIALLVMTVLPAVAAAQPATMGGTVTGAGSPLAGASIMIEQLFKGGLPKSVRTITTAADGSWSYTGSPGQYRLTVSATGFYAKTITVDLRKSAFPVDIDLSPVPEPTGTINGRITNSSGTGLHGYVYFFKQNADGTWPDAYLKQVETVTGGAYSSGALPLGSYRVRLFSVMSGWEWWNNVPTPDLATPVVLDTPGQVIDGIDAQL